ncbi:hypothetical protein BsWGS_19041 [Bradybaena similaris]
MDLTQNFVTKCSPAATMADTTPRELEADAFGEIKFLVDVGSSSHVTYQIECNLTAPKIAGLKEDFEDMFNIPCGSQKWYFKGILLNDDQTLWKSGIQITGKKTTIEVKRT